MLAQSGAGRRQGPADQRCLGTSTPLPSLTHAGCPASLVSGCAAHRDGPPGPGRMGQANCCCVSRWAPPAALGRWGTARSCGSGIAHACRSLLCREALTNAEPVQSADVQLIHGRKRSERCLLLLPGESVIAKLQ